MKKIIIFAAFLAIFSAASCGNGKNDSIKAGAACEPENLKSCSSDGSEILVCSGSSWQTEKECYLYLGQYCRRTPDGEFGCTDNGNPSDSSGTADDSIITNDDENSETNDDSGTDNGENQPDSDNTDNDYNDSAEDSDYNSDSSDDTENSEDVSQDLETCSDILKCISECASDDTKKCTNSCYSRGTTEASNDYYEYKNKCGTYTGINDLVKCQEIAVRCGQKGDESYAAPYGHAVVDGSFAQILEAGVQPSPADTAAAFVTGTFGSNGNIPDPTSTASFSFARISSDGEYILLEQTYSEETGKTPAVRFVINAHEPGTYLVGLGEKIEIYVSESATKEAKCDHAFGYGHIELDGTALAGTLSAGAGTLTVKGEIDLYNYKNAPMYDENASDDGRIACEPQ